MPYKNPAKKKANAAEWYQKNKQKYHDQGQQKYATEEGRFKARVASARLQWSRKLKALSLLGGKCVRCDQDHPAALQFHHIDPTTKLFNLDMSTLARGKKYPWELIEAELEKCEILCASCHFIHHSMDAKIMQGVIDHPLTDPDLKANLERIKLKR